MFDTERVTGDLVRDAVRDHRALLSESLGLLVAQEYLLVQLARRAGGADPLDDHIVLVPGKVLQDALERFLRVAVRLDIELVQQPAGLDLDQCALGCGAATINTQHHLSARRYLWLEALTGLVYARETIGQGRRESSLLPTVFGHAVEQFHVQHERAVLLNRLDGRTDSRDVMMMLRPDDRHSEKLRQVRSHQVVAKYATRTDGLALSHT